MKKILMIGVMLLLLTACGGKAEELQLQVDDLTVQVEDLQGELDLAESTVSLCVTSLEEEVAYSSGLEDDLSAFEDDLQACLDELEAETTEPEAEPEVGGGAGECDFTERIVMISTPVLQQSVNRKGEPQYNANGKMVMVAVPDSRISGFVVGDTVCVSEHYPVSGGWAVFLIEGPREAYFNIFIPAHYLEPLD